MAYVWVALIGIFGGVVSGLFGVGGGLIFVPLLIVARQFDPHVAIGTSLAAIVPTAIVGAYRHFRSDMLDFKTVAVLVVFAAIGAWIGSGLSLRLDVSILRRLLAVFLAVLSFKMFFQN